MGLYSVVWGKGKDHYSSETTTMPPSPVAMKQTEKQQQLPITSSDHV